MKQTVLLLMLIASVGLGCKFFGGSSSGSNGGSTSGGAGGGSDPKGDVIAASKKLIDLKSFSAKMQGTGSSGEIKQQVDYQAPDRYHVIYQAGAAPGMEIIFIGSDMYMKSAGGKFSK